MLIGDDAVEFVSQLNEDLAEKSLTYTSRKFNESFPRFVPWMCLACLTDTEWTNTSIFFEDYERGELVTDKERVSRIAEFLQKDGRLIIESMNDAKAGLSSYQDVSLIPDIKTKRPDAIVCYQRARTLLRESDPMFSGLFASLIHFVIPVQATSSRFDCSTHLARGAIFLSLPQGEQSELTMTIDLAHELGHQALMVFQSADPLIASNLEELVWSGIRQTYRPAIQCMQAMAALAYMTVLTNRLRRNPTFSSGERAFLEENHESQLVKMQATASELRGKCRFTEVGTLIMQEFDELRERSQSA